MRWFKHMSFARNDEDMAAMIDMLGTESYGTWWIIVEMVAEQMDKSDKHFARFSIKKWSKSCGVSVKKFQKTVSFLSEVGTISTETTEKFPEFLKISIPKLLNFRDEWSKRSGVTTDKNKSDSRATTEQETEAEVETEVNKLFVEKAFEKWWKTSPKRNGRRVGKDKAKTKFSKIDQKKWNDLKTATINYCDYLKKSGISAMDGHRFLSGEWVDYIKNAEHSNKSKSGSNEVPEWLK